MEVVYKLDAQTEMKVGSGAFCDDGYANLPGGEGDTCQFLRDLIKAILEVEDHYYRVEYEVLSIDAEDLYERAFAYELYHQWSKYIDIYKHTEPDKANLCLNGEIKKCFWDEKKLPDLVLHQYEVDCQELIVEIKREPSADGENIVKDLEKLSKFTCGRLEFGERRINNNFAPYNMGVFILTGGTLKTLANKLSDEYNNINDIVNDLEKVGKQIFCLCIPLNGTVEFATVHEVKEVLEGFKNE